MKKLLGTVTIRLILGTWALASSGLFAEAGVIVNQPSDYPGAFNAITSQSQQSGANYQSFDNFNATAASVLSITWQGIYWDPRSLSLNPPDSPPHTLPPGSFGIGIYTNANNLPGTRIGPAIGLTLTATNIVGQAKFGPDNAGSYDTVNVKNFSANLNTPFDLSPYAGQQLWLSIVWLPTNNPSYPPVWLWTSGQGLDGKSAQYNYTTQAIYYSVGDRAFSLSSNTDSQLPPQSSNEIPTGQLADAPEPGSLSLAVAAFVLCLAATFSRRRRVCSRKAQPSAS